jgi:SAM-dependent methyltransferase
MLIMTGSAANRPNREIDPQVIDRNYENSANVRARFALYDFAENQGKPVEDIAEFAVNTLRAIGKLPVEAAVLDVGTADARLLDYLRFELGHEGPLYGVDPNTKQFKNHGKDKLSPGDWQAVFKRGLNSELNQDAIRYLVDNDLVKVWTPPENIELKYGRAHDLSQLKDDSFDASFAMFMLYHVPKSQRPQAIQELIRVTKPEGVNCVATSGRGNKINHRLFEKGIAEELGITPPPPMNAGFTSEKAAEELPEHYEHVYRYDQNNPIVINDSERRVGAYVASIRSLRDQFEPVPPAELFEAALQKVVQPVIKKVIDKTGVFEDRAHRTIFFGSQAELELPAELGFQRLA